MNTVVIQNGIQIAKNYTTIVKMGIQWIYMNWVTIESVFPNPTNDIININTSLNDVNYVLYDLTGRVLQRGEGVKREEVNISNYPNAVYLLRIEYGGNIYNKKIIKEDR